MTGFENDKHPRGVIGTFIRRLHGRPEISLGGQAEHHCTVPTVSGVPFEMMWECDECGTLWALLGRDDSVMETTGGRSSTGSGW
jgi:hypothetical protein